MVKFCSFFLLCIFSLAASIERVSLPDADRQYMKELIMQEHADHTEIEANKAIYELENYYTGIRDGLFLCGPPRKLDVYYHLHVLNTRLYRAFCQATFGRFIDHEPFWSGNPSTSEHQAECENQMDLLEAHGLNITCPCLWRTSILTSKTTRSGPTDCLIHSDPILV